MKSLTLSYKNHRFPPQIIARAIWLYFRFPLSRRRSRKCCWGATLSCLTKRYGNGAAIRDGFTHSISFDP
jgi:hypothetical protein